MTSRAVSTSRHSEISSVAQALNTRIQAFGSQRRTFEAMQDEVVSTRKTRAPELLRQVQERHQKSGLSPEQWEQFLLIYKGDVDQSLNGYIGRANRQVIELTGDPVPTGDPNTKFIADNADLSTLKLTSLQAEMMRLEALISADKNVRQQYAALSKRIAKESSTLQNFQNRLADAQGAPERRKVLQVERDETYGRVFQAIIDEQTELADLYAPLVQRLEHTAGTLSKLGFSVQRIVDVETWGDFAEENLLDRRKAGPFNGRGSLVALATKELKPVWESGTAAEVQAAMAAFITTYLPEIIKHALFDRSDESKYRNWLKQFAHWLFATDHITVRYEMLYDGIDIRKLSPGTRGIVLLLLYLALDDADDRPLIIDQPEENLDPKSVYEELVSLFVAAKGKRQVIMVTHNANLVINTDADQIIVAEAGPHQTGGLPPITYKAGGLENADIRKAVCDILEGGERAFQERARRIRVRLE